MQNKVSGKPDAGEWAERIWQGFCDDIGVSIKETIANGLADFRRETLLWLINMFYGDDDGVDYCACCHRCRGSHSAQCRVAELERLAESCGRK